MNGTPEIVRKLSSVGEQLQPADIARQQWQELREYCNANGPARQQIDAAIQQRLLDTKSAGVHGELRALQQYIASPRPSFVDDVRTIATAGSEKLQEGIGAATEMAAAGVEVAKPWVDPVAAKEFVRDETGRVAESIRNRDAMGVATGAATLALPVIGAGWGLWNAGRHWKNALFEPVQSDSFMGRVAGRTWRMLKALLVTGLTFGGVVALTNGVKWAKDSLTSPAASPQPSPSPSDAPATSVTVAPATPAIPPQSPAQAPAQAPATEESLLTQGWNYLRSFIPGSAPTNAAPSEAPKQA